jgi:hypothetical protein
MTDENNDLSFSGTRELVEIESIFLLTCPIICGTGRETKSSCSKGFISCTAGSCMIIEESNRTMKATAIAATAAGWAILHAGF